MAARVILLNGTSSAGKSTLAAALRPLLPPTFCCYASDQLADAGFRPLDRTARWQGRGAFFDGFHRSIGAFAAAGLDLVVEHVVERADWAVGLAAALADVDLFSVAVRAPVTILEDHERRRGDRTIGEARTSRRLRSSAA